MRLTVYFSINGEVQDLKMSTVEVKKKETKLAFRLDRLQDTCGDARRTSIYRPIDGVRWTYESSTRRLC